MHWRPRVSLLVLLVLFAVGCGRSPQHYVDLANKQFQAKKYDDASINYRKAIQKDPNLGEAYYGLGKVLLQKGKAAEAYGVLDRAVTLSPGNLDAKQKLANLALAAYLSDRRRPKNLYTQLNKLAAQFLARDANSYDGLRLKAYLALNDNQRDSALDYFRRALQAKPLDPEITVNLAGALLEDPATAPEGEKLALDLTQKRKEVGAAWDLMYRYYAGAKRTAEAENMLKSKVAANPNQAAYHLELAEYYRRSGNPEQMKTALAALLNDSKTFPAARRLVGDFYDRAGNRQEALRYYEEGIQAAADKDKLPYQKREVAVLTALGQQDRALDLLQTALQANPKDSELHMARALLLVDQRKADAAIQELQGLETADKGNVLVKYHLGRALLLKGQAKEAAAKWEEAAKLRPAYIDPKLALASYNLDIGKFGDAERWATQATNAQPGNLRAQLLRSGALQGLGQFADAETILSGLRRQLPDNAEVALDSALLDLRQKRPADAEKTLRTLYTPGQENLRPLTGLEQSLLFQKKNDDALRLLETDLAKAPGRQPVQLMLANVQALTGHRDAAVHTLDQLVAAHPDNLQAHVGLGQIQAAQGELENAMANFQKAHELAPQNIQPVLLLAETADRMGRTDAARQNYQAALKLDPANLMAMNNLAYLDADTGGNLDEAMRLITSASQKLPQQPNLSDTLGYVYLKQKKLSSALQVFGSLAQRYPQNATYRFHHALALLESGSRDQAKRELEAALAAKPTADLATKIREALGRVG